MLGLTFTRKAAGELAARIRKRIEQLVAAGHVPRRLRPVRAADGRHLQLVRQHDLPRQRDPGRAARATARCSARRAPGSSPDRWRRGRATTALPIAREEPRPGDRCRAAAEPGDEREHRRPRRGARVRRCGSPRPIDLPPGGRRSYRRGRMAAHGRIARRAASTSSPSTTGEARAQRSSSTPTRWRWRSRSCGKQPRVVGVPRRATRSCCSTSTRTPRSCRPGCSPTLFGGHPVMAVGDPNQSIYGWRGASGVEPRAVRRAVRRDRAARSPCRRAGATARASSMPRTPSSPRSDWSRACPVERLVAVRHGERPRRSTSSSPSTSRTRPTRSPTGSPTGSEPIDAPIPPGPRQRRAPLPRAQDAARLPRRAPAHGRSLPRARHRRPARRARDRRHRQRCCRCSHDPEAGLELVRVLAGSRWRIGVQDLHALNRLASWLRDRDHTQHEYADDVKARMRASLTEGEGGSIVDALDFRRACARGHSALRAVQRGRARRGCARPATVIARLRGAHRVAAPRPRHPGRAGAPARHRGRRQRVPPARRRPDGGVLRRDRRLPRARRLGHRSRHRAERLPRLAARRRGA